MMPKISTQFVCQQCGYSTPQWFGKCPSCGEWNTLAEIRISARAKSEKLKVKSSEAKPLKLAEIKTTAKNRISTGIEEFDRVLGEGLVPGSAVLLAGEPGIGKSTLLLQLCQSINQQSSIINQQLLYVSGEESPEQIKLKAERLEAKSGNLLIVNETSVEAVIEQIGQENYSMVVVDSIQTLWSEELVGTAGSIGQVRECAAKLINLTKPRGIPLFLVGQVTKEGAIAGPMTLAHMVDVVLFLEGERFQALRLLRGIKNRFGPTDEVGVFEMTDKGMIGVDNPSKLFLGSAKPVAGSVVFCAMEGTRPILVEIQALVTKSFLAVPRRVTNGFDYNRLILLTAVLQKSLSLPLWDQDIYLNIAGGFKVGEPAADLAVCLAIISSFKNKPLLAKTCAFGEVGLLGEIRRVSQEEKREKEAKRLGFENLVSSKNSSSLLEALINF